MSATQLPAERTLRLIPRLARWAQARVGEDDISGDLSLRQLSALQLIADDESTTLGDVARQLMVTPAVVTGLIDRLEKRGYVRRVSSTGDRRRVNLAVTPEGKKASRAAEGRLVSDVAAKMDEFSANEMKNLEQGLALLERVAKDLEVERGTARRI